uniref:Uncharacterized protein n=1 Tax=viral metagenome TaxID=1070528 RepID=A0A6C0LFN3_9ZZZZ
MQQEGLQEISETFLQKGWQLTVNEPSRLEFQSPTNHYDMIEFEINKNNIFVSVPLKTSRYKYSAKFSDTSSASTFAEMHLSNY